MAEVPPVRFGLLTSSSGGSTVEHAIRHAHGGSLMGLMEPAVVIATRPNAGGIEKAKALGVPTVEVYRSEFPKGDDGLRVFGEELLKYLHIYEAAGVAQLGLLDINPPNVVRAYKHTIFNQHPGALDPEHGNIDFGGKNMYGERVSAATLAFHWATNSMPTTEATTHSVTPDGQYDKGRVLQRTSLVLPPHERVPIWQMERDPERQQELIEAAHKLSVELGPIEKENVVKTFALMSGRQVPGIEMARQRTKPLIDPIHAEIHARAKALAVNLYRRS